MNAPVRTQPDPVRSDARPPVRLVIAGHVDHGKSTLIGRLLHETGAITADKLARLQAMSARRGMDFEWSFAVDSLQAERDQGITIDTSQIGLRTAHRDVVLIDAPGHAEFLRNMITGAAQADAALLVIDAADGIREQTRRHAYMLHVLGLRQVIVVINKMDRIDFVEARFKTLEAELRQFVDEFGLDVQAVIPIAARLGEGIAAHSAVPWYRGPCVIEAIDRLAPARASAALALRLPVQAVYKFGDARILAGRVESGRIAVGDDILIMPAAKSARVRSIESWPAASEASEARAGRSVGITLERDLFVERGDVIAPPASLPKTVTRLRARVFWLAKDPLEIGASVTVRLGTAEARADVTAIRNVLDPAEVASTDATSIAHNHVGEVTFDLARPVAVDPHHVNPRLGRVVIDWNGRIAGGGLVLGEDIESIPRTKATNVVPVASAIGDEERLARSGQRGAVLWLTGLPGAGKSTLANALERRLFARGGTCVLLDGDTLRTGLNADLGFSSRDRAENVRRIAEVAAHLARSGIIAVVAAVSPNAEERARARRIGGAAFYEIHVAASLAVCEARDPKGHYRRARAGEIKGFTGIDAPYEAPQEADLVIDTGACTIEAAADQLERLLVESRLLASRQHSLTGKRADETHARSVVKAISWRTAGSMDTFLLTLLVTGSGIFAGTVASAETVTKVALYYLHERLWSRIPWGKR